MVWRSQDPLLQRSVAVKLIHPRLADDPGFAQALAEEARRVAVLSVPGIARLLDTGEQDGVTYLVREYAPGSCLRERLDRAGPASPSEAVRIGVAALGALAEAHDRGVLHLALDPDDVIVGEDGRVCLIDFGIGAAVAASRPTEAAALLGDEHLAPEQLAGTEPDARADVYAIASLLFALLTGEPPRGRTSARAARPDVPRTLDRVLARALDPDPERRFPDARAFADALARSVETEPVDVSDEGRSAEPVHLDRRAARRGGARDRRDHAGSVDGQARGGRAARDPRGARRTRRGRDPTRRDPTGVRRRDRSVRRRRRALVERGPRRRRGRRDRVAVGELLRRRARQARVRAPARPGGAARGPGAAAVDAASGVPVRRRGR